MASAPIGDKALKNIRLDLAHDLILDDSDHKNQEQIFKKSGSEYILKKLRQKLFNFNPKLIFFEHSYFVTSVQNNKNAVFVCLWSDNSIPSSQLNKFQYFFDKLGVEFEQEYPILWHKDFFIKPKELNFYYSDINLDYSDVDIINLKKYIDANYNGDQKVFKIRSKISETSEEIFSGNFLFPSIFEFKVDEVLNKGNNPETNSIDQNLLALHKAYDIVFEKPEFNTEKTYTYKLAIPILGAPSHGDKFGLGSVWIYFVTRKYIDTKILKHLAKECSITFKDISVNYIFQSGLESTQKAQFNSLQVAVAQIFARNFAHNIGSHVAIRSTNKAVKDRINFLFGYDQDKKYNFVNSSLKILDWLDYTSGVLDIYEITRNEFLAEPRLPPKNIYFYRDVILPFVENTLLMDNIAASENICYENNGNRNRLKIRVFHNGIELKAIYNELCAFAEEGCGNSDLISYPDNFPYLVQPKNIDLKTLEEAFNDKIIENDFEICLNSEHSFYSILENFIRNSAKHNKDKLNNGHKDLEINIDIKDYDDGKDFFSVFLYDNISNVTSEKFKKLYNNIEADLFSIDGPLSQGSLGIADMKINAHLLQSQANITKDNIKNALKIFKISSPDNSYNLEPLRLRNLTKHQEQNHLLIGNNEKDLNHSFNFTYHFRLTKPKKILWIGHHVKDNLDKLEWRKRGVIFKNVDYINYLIKKSSSNKSLTNNLAAYTFAILEKSAVDNLDMDSLDDLLLQLPFRVLINCTSSCIDTNSDLKKICDERRIQVVEKIFELNEVDAFWLLKMCWKNWLKRWHIPLKSHLYIYLDNDIQTDKWLKINFDDLPFSVTFFKNRRHVEKPVLSPEEYVVFYDRHGVAYREKCNFHKEGFSFITGGAYFEFDKSSDDFVKLFYPSNDSEINQLVLFEAFEAGLMNVVVLDERIAQKLSYSDENTKIITKNNGFFVDDQLKACNAGLMNNGRTFVVTNFMNEENLSEINNFKLSYVSGQISLIGPTSFQGLNLIYDGLIIHRTYLNNLLEQSQSFYKSDRFDSGKALMKALNAKFNRVVVTSGGGYPHSLPVPVHFQPFSLLNKNFIKYLSKMSLLKLF